MGREERKRLRDQAEYARTYDSYLSYAREPNRRELADKILHFATCTVKLLDELDRCTPTVRSDATHHAVNKRMSGKSRVQYAVKRDTGELFLWRSGSSDWVRSLVPENWELYPLTDFVQATDSDGMSRLVWRDSLETDK